MTAKYVPRRRYIEIGEMTGCMFRVEESTTFENPYHFTGDCKIEGVTYFINSWIMRDRRGRKYLSLRFKKKVQPTANKYNNFKLQSTTFKKPKYAPLDEMEAIEARRASMDKK